MKKKLIATAVALVLAGAANAAKIDEAHKDAIARYSELVKVEAAMLRHFINSGVDYVSTVELQRLGLLPELQYKIESVRFGSADENLATRYALRMTELEEDQGRRIADRCNLKYMDQNLSGVGGSGEMLNKCLFDPARGELIYFYKDEWN